MKWFKRVKVKIENKAAGNSLSFLLIKFYLPGNIVAGHQIIRKKDNGVSKAVFVALALRYNKNANENFPNEKGKHVR
ncbi:hypothetical protein LCY76_04130 [Fictibacillus sp. KIGAM418]|uniref:Uncharacterized protein n=1 Tax=Fictibacillus marinisediminis TaxID=2878389 RepID=A0A9X2BCI6_9BACL|nr:hypothetical protein [Fictibacillus marinisediminis]MCK6255790.1 hypothetical protein [Fictibacillus marinisediminis]